MTKSRITISDHALVRWLERTGALDVEQLRGRLADSLQRACTAANQLEAARFTIIADGLIYIVREGKLVTVYFDEGQGARVKASD